MSIPLTVEPVADPKGILELVKFPFKLYKGDPNWVPPFIEERRDFFDPRKNPFYEHARYQLYLARRGREVVGTIGAAVNDNHNAFHNEQAGVFGFFEAVNDQAVADALFDAAEGWLRGQGMQTIRGPLSFSTNDECGALIDGFDEPPMVMMTYNPRYYPALIEGHGYRKAMDLFAWIADDITARLQTAPQKLFTVAEKVVQKEGIRLRELDRKHLDRDIALIKQIYNGAWEKNWGFVPLTDAEIDHLVKALLPLVDTRLIFLAETADGQPIGVSLTLPDLHQALKRAGGGHMYPFGLLKFLWHRRKIDQARLLIMGVIEKYRGRGVDAYFYLTTARKAAEYGYKRLEGSWILETNTMMNRIIERLGGIKYKTYRIYEKPL
jgi:GNAT superfamily N-acetyltransferase